MMDTDREREIGLATNYPFEALEPGEIILHESWQKDFGYQVGETLGLSFEAKDFWNAISVQYNQLAQVEGWPQAPALTSDKAEMQIPGRIAAFIDETYGKMPKTNVENQIIMEFTNYLRFFAEYLPAELDGIQEYKDFLRLPDTSTSFAQILMMTLPSPRYDHYQNSNFDAIQANVLSYSNQIVDALGFYPVVTYLDLLDQMQTYSMAVLFVGLIFGILLILFVIVSILLIYSLLLISVETKTFEIGVMRLVGLSKAGFVSMIFTQAAMFVIPAILLGFAASIPLMYMLYAILFTEDLGFEHSLYPEAVAVTQALCLGLLIPTISAIIPIRRALSTNLNDALTPQRSKSTGILVSYV